MRKIFFILSICIIAVTFFACSSTKPPKKVIVGLYSWTEWQQNAEWSKYTAASYTPDIKTVETLKKMIHDKKPEIEIFSGSWCSDSENNLPKIFKLFEQCGSDIKSITIYGVDREKTEPTGKAVEISIQKVPTLVVYLNKFEIGRIVENPTKSWEDDLLQILSK